jgi:DNA-binding SARP family transcriptional activator
MPQPRFRSDGVMRWCTEGAVVRLSGATARLSLLNGFSLKFAAPERSQETIDNLPLGVQRLLAHLALSGARARPVVAGVLWPNVPEEHAQASLRTTLWRLQKTAPGIVHTSHAAIKLVPGVAVDVQDLEDWARRVLDARTDIDTLVTPMSALRSELLPGWYDDWVLIERERVQQLRLYALERLSVRLATAGKFGEAVQAASAAVIAEPLRESAQRALIRVHIAQGNQLEALKQYDAYRTMLADELSVGPTKSMEQLMRPLLAARGDLPAQRSPEGPADKSGKGH